MPVVVLLTGDGDHVPVTPLLDVVGSTGAADPLHIGAGVVNVGTVCGVTVTVNVAVVAHNPAVGVNVYVPVVVLSTGDGDHVPVTPLLDVVGSTGAADPLHIGAGVVKVGTVCEVTLTVTVAVVAQSPAVGVNVYVPVFVLSTVDGDQVPVTPLLDVVGRTGAADPLHMGADVVKVGTVCGVTVTVRVAVVAHKPAVGVNV